MTENDSLPEEMPRPQRNFLEENQKYLPDIYRAQDGDEASFERLLTDVIYPKGRKIINWMLRAQPRSIQEEELQNLAIATFTKIREFNPEVSNFAGWVKAFAKNICRAFLRRSSHKVSEVPLENDDSEDACPTDHNEALQDRSISKEQLMVRQEMVSMLIEYINELPPSSRDVIKMELSDQVSFEEIAAQKGLNAGTVRKYAFTARKLLREWLAADPRFDASVFEI